MRLEGRCVEERDAGEGCAAEVDIVVEMDRAATEGVHEGPTERACPNEPARSRIWQLRLSWSTGTGSPIEIGRSVSLI
jgi:hypothetical protein